MRARAGAGRGGAPLLHYLVLLLLPFATGWQSEEPPAPDAPRFPQAAPRALLAAVGADVVLDCRVLHQGEKAVSWIRSRDLQILSHGGAVFTADSRVSAAETRGAPADVTPPDTTSPDLTDADVTRHTLTIRQLRRSDSGRYECQVNTEPKMSLFFNLTVLESLPTVSVWVEGGGAVWAGAPAALRCEARYDAAAAGSTPLEPAWFRGEEQITFQSVGGGVSIVSERWAGGARSQLSLAAAAARDGGRYSCHVPLPSGETRSAALHLTVLDNTASVEAMQRDEAAWRGAGGSGAALPLAAPARLAALALLAAAAALLLQP